MQRGGIRELTSASRNGEVKLWDIRNDKSVQSFHVTSAGLSTSSSTAAPNNHEEKPTLLRSLSVHEHAPVFAVGTDRHEVKSFSMAGESLGVFEPLASRGLSAGVLGGRGRGNAIVATAYHPHEMVLACAALGDGHVSLLKY